jgi:hypothetical protein
MLNSLVLFALAAAPVDAGHGATIVGWSKDGRYVVWTHSISNERIKHHYYQSVKGKQVEVKDPRKLPEAERAALKEHHTESTSEDMPDETELTETLQLATVYDVQHEEQQVYVMKDEELCYQGGHALLDKYAPKGADVASFDQWKKDHPIAGKSQRLGPNGAKADIVVEGVERTWRGEAVSWEVIDATTVTFVTSVNKRAERLSLPQEMAAMYAPNFTAEVWWDPTGRRAMFALDQHDAHTMRSLETFTVQLYFLGGGTAVELLSTKALQPSAVKSVDAIEGAGFAVTARGEAQKARPSTVVYCDDKHQAEAQKIAAAIPGGATVEKLSWKANGDVVVALGDTAK